MKKSTSVTTREAREERRVRVFVAWTLVFLFLTVLFPLQVHARVRGEILRFHVVANSDSPEDQALKEEVRSFLLERTKVPLSKCKTREEAAAFLEEHRALLVENVRTFLKKRGCFYSVRAALREEFHAEKVYGDLTLPAGEYLSFRVELGKGEGQNFFCVLFPPICKQNARKSASSVFSDYGFSPYGLRCLKAGEGREVRFFLVRLLQKLTQM